MPPSDQRSSATGPTTAARVVLLPGDRFFVRRIPLLPDAPAAAQIELALETLAPFAPEHLYHGHLIDAAGRHALIYAAYRRNFPADEQADWDDAEAVIPAFLAWVVARPALGLGSPGLLVETTDGLTGLGWDDASELPAVVLSQRNSDSGHPVGENALVTEITRRSGIAADKITAWPNRPPDVRPASGGLQVTVDEQEPVMLPTKALATADVRDKLVLGLRRRHAARTRFTWRFAITTMAALGLCLVAELGLRGGGFWLEKQRELMDARAPEISAIESAQNLAARLEQLSATQLKPFEMLAAINRPRPASVEFVRVSTNGPLQLVVEAQTNNAADLRTYESALRQLGGVATVDLRDPRMRDGRTSFSLHVTFKAGWLAGGGAL
jgi:hypothetical protein